MSQDRVLTVVERKCRAIPYTVAVHANGAPDGGMPQSDIPGFVLDKIDTNPRVITLGRTVEHTYEIRITLYLGLPASSSVSIKERDRQAGYDDAMISAFKDDWQLLDAEGLPTCHNCDLTDGTNNFDTFREENTAARKQWRLFVTEHI